MTGGAGFIGSHLVDALIGRGDDVIVIDDLSFGDNLNQDAELVKADVRTATLVFAADVVFHLAAQADVQRSVRDPVFDASTNIIGTIRVLEAAKSAGARVVFASSGGAIYGERKTPAKEDSPLRPTSPYGLSKLCAERYVQEWDPGHVILRLGNVYGPRQRSVLEGGVAAIFLDQMLNGSETVIFGDGSQTRDFVFVGDVVDAFLVAADQPGGVFNVATGASTSIAHLHAACQETTTTCMAPRLLPDRTGDLRHSRLDVGRIHAKGWAAATSLHDGLAQTAAGSAARGSMCHGKSSNNTTTL